MFKTVKRVIGKARTAYRSSVSGRFVTKDYADKHPKQTEKETL